MSKETLLFRPKGLVRVCLTGPNGDFSVAEFHNELQDTGLDAMADALSTTRGISHMYLLYVNSGSIPAFNPASGTVTAAQLQDVSGNKGYARVPVTLSDRVGPVLTFAAISSPGATAGAALIDETSHFYGAGLVMEGDVIGPAEDTLFSAVRFKDSGGSDFTITKIANAQVGVSWELTIGRGA